MISTNSMCISLRSFEMFQAVFSMWITIVDNEIEQPHLAQII